MISSSLSRKAPAPAVSKNPPYPMEAPAGDLPAAGALDSAAPADSSMHPQLAQSPEPDILPSSPMGAFIHREVFGIHVSDSSRQSTGRSLAGITAEYCARCKPFLQQLRSFVCPRRDPHISALSHHPLLHQREYCVQSVPDI